MSYAAESKIKLLSILFDINPQFCTVGANIENAEFGLSA